MYFVQEEVVVEDRMEGVEEKVVVKAAAMSKHRATTEKRGRRHLRHRWLTW